MFHRKLLKRLLKPTLGTSATDSLLAEEDPRILKRIQRNRRVALELKNGLRHLEDAHRSIRDNLRAVVAPLVLISQPHLSGGYLLNALFDGHPELDTRPGEWTIGGAHTFSWSVLDLEQDPENLFEKLFETDLIVYSRDGMVPSEENPESFLFIFLPSLQRDLFLKCLAERPVRQSLRDLMQAYLSSFFAAWVNNQNSLGVKRYVTACAPPAAVTLDNAKTFFDVYPDGHLISVLRHPFIWAQQIIRRRPSAYPDTETALDAWCRDVQEIRRTKEAFPARTNIIRFEDLADRTEGVMRWLAARLNIAFEKSLLTPTFNTYALGSAVERTTDPDAIEKKDPTGKRETALAIYRQIPFTAPLT